jgi:FkbM family methyltransferase
MILQQVYEHCLRKGHTCFDVGANIGMTTEIMAPLVGPTGLCYSFECHPLHYMRLAFLASRPDYQNVRPYCFALSDQVGHITLYTGGDPAASQASTIIPELGNTQRLGKTIARIKVETTTIDIFCRAHGVAPDVIKIDVEGAEALVFAGAQETIRHKLPHLVFEFGYDHFRPGYTPFQYTFCESLGYSFYLVDLFCFHGNPGWLLDEKAMLYPIDKDDIVRAQLCGNILAVHASKAASLLDGVTMIPFKDLEPSLHVSPPTAAKT